VESLNLLQARRARARGAAPVPPVHLHERYVDHGSV
jgi:hypothetical protein